VRAGTAEQRALDGENPMTALAKLAAAMILMVAVAICTLYSVGALAMGVIRIGDSTIPPLFAGPLAIVVGIVGMYGFAVGCKWVIETVSLAAERISPEFAAAQGWRRHALNVLFLVIVLVMLALITQVYEGPVPDIVAGVVTTASLLIGAIQVIRSLRKRRVAV